MTTQSFPRQIDALPAIFAFSAASFGQLGIAPELLGSVDFALEELFTNMVKYGGGALPVTITLVAMDGGVEVCMSDPGVDRFDPRSAPEVNTQATLEQRQPGGLGLYLIGRMLDTIDYRYDEASRCGRLRFTKTGPPAADGGPGRAEVGKPC